MDRLINSKVLRRVGLPLLRLFGRDITITHPYTRHPFRIHSFKHKGYWWHGVRREQRTMELFRQLVKPDFVVIEAGAHVGYISTFLGSLCREVHVFEPDPNNLSYLLENTQTFPNIHVHSKGLSNDDGTMVLYSESLTGQNSSFVPDFQVFKQNASLASADVSPESVEVPVTSIDHFVSSRGLKVDFLKIDVEGFEETVLRGAERTLMASRPTLVVEVNYGTALSAIQLLKQYGYQPRCINTDGFPFVKDNDNRTQNLLCLSETVNWPITGLSG